MTKDRRELLPIVFLAGIFIAPFVFWPWSQIAYEIPKVWFINRWIEILAISGVVTSFWTLKKEKIDFVLVTLVTLFLTWVIISSLFGIDPSKSISGNYFRADGILTLLHLIILFIFIALFFKKHWLIPTVKALSYSSILISLFTNLNGILVLTNQRPFFKTWEGAIGVNFGNPNFLAGYLVVTLPFLAYLFTKSKKSHQKFLIFLGVLFQLTAILLTQSWSGLLGSLLFLLGLVFISTRKRLVYLLPIVLLGLIAAFFFFSDYKQKQTPGITIAEGRERIIMKGLLAFLKRPVFGWGWANFDYAFESSDWPVKFENDVYVDKAHSHFLEILTTSGLVGISFYLLIIFKVFLNVVGSQKPISRYILLSFLLFLFHSQTNIISISEELVFWIISGISTKMNSL